MLGLAFQLCGDVLLHAAAVMIGDEVIALCAPCGVGKSSLAALLVCGGADLVADDILAVEDRIDGIYARPQLPELKLWGDSLEALGDDGMDCTPVTRGIDKWRIPVAGARALMTQDLLPLKALYFLEPSNDPGQEIEFLDIDSISAVLRVMGNMYWPSMVRGLRAVRALRVAAKLTSKIQVRRVRYYRSYRTIKSLGQALRCNRRAVPAS